MSADLDAMKSKFTLRDLIYIIVIVAGMLSNFLNTKFSVDTLERDVSEIKATNPVLMQYQLNEMGKKVDNMEKQINEIYKAIVLKPTTTGDSN